MYSRCRRSAVQLLPLIREAGEGLQEGGITEDRVAYAAAHVRVASCDAGRANDGRADAHGSLGHHNDDEVCAPCPVNAPIRD